MVHSTEKVIFHNVGLLNLAEQFQNVSQACKVTGFSRDTFYRYNETVDECCVDALLEKTRNKPNMRNSVEPSSQKSRGCAVNNTD